MSKIEEAIDRISEKSEIRELGEVLHLIKEEITKETLKKIDMAKLAEKLEDAQELRDIVFLLQEVGTPPFVQLSRRIFNDIDFQKFGKKLKDLSQMGLFILLVRQLPRNLKPELPRIIKFSDLQKKMNEEMNIWGIGTFLNEMVKTNLIVSRKIIQGLDQEIVQEKINEEDSLWGINTFLESLLKVDYRMWLGITNKIQYDSLVKKIHGASLSEISRSLELFLREKKFANKLFQHLNLDKLAKKIDKSSDILSILHVLENIMTTNPSYTQTLLQNIDLDVLSQKIHRQNQNLREYAVDTFVNKKGAQPLLDRLLPK